MSRSVPGRASLRLETACALSNRFDSVETGCVGGPSHVHAWGLHHPTSEWWAIGVPADALPPGTIDAGGDEAMPSCVPKAKSCLLLCFAGLRRSVPC